MNARARNWPSLALWLILAVSGGWAIYLFATNYGSCRTNGYGQITCFVITLLFSCVEVLAFVVMTTTKILMSILP
jgi:hypothetical protein